MSLRRNILATFASQLYTALIGIVMVPVLVRYMGPEAYGLVGFYAMLQVWFFVLDLGFTPTIGRQAARFRGGAVHSLDLRRLLRTLEGLFLAVAFLGAASISGLADLIATRWLDVQQLPLDEVRNAVALMAIVVALRWVAGLYRGTINGFEHLVWLGGFNIAVATARFVLVVPFFHFVGTKPTEFFSYQLAVALIEMFILAWMAYALMPKLAPGQRVEWKWGPLREVIPLSLSIAATSSAWILVTQTDKLILSKLLPLTEYAYFTIAVLLASAIVVVSSPVSSALIPRLTKLNAQDDHSGLLKLYRESTQLVALVAIPITAVLSLFPAEVLWVWTGNAEITQRSSQVLALYAAGNGILALTAFPYYLQLAKGNLKLHLIGNGIFIAIFVPLLIELTSQHGMVGAGYAWVTANVVPFLFWVPVVHRRFLKGIHFSWLLRDVVAVTFPTLLGAAAARAYISWPQDRIHGAAMLMALGLACLTIAVASSSWARGQLWLVVIGRQRLRD